MKKIDSHAHYITPSYRAYALKKFNAALPEWNVDDQLATNRDNEIVYSLLGISMPYFDSEDIQEEYRAVMENNDEIAAMLKGHESELGFLAALPMPDAKLSIVEIDRALALGAAGFTFDTNMNGVYLGQPQLDAIMEKLDAVHAIAVFHPTKPTAVPAGVLEDFRVQALEFFYDTTRAFVNMSRNRVFERYPNIRWIVPHAGALVPAIADRVQSSFKLEDKGANLFEDLARVYFDLAGPSEPRLLNILKTVAPAEHFLYGTDYPYTVPKDVEKYRLVYENTDKLTQAQKERMFFANAAGLLKLA